ncbi:MAG: hypothetical protein FJ387_18465 [Verrucomicrobia bacterium]|nr:hypothetical protein [Verrucomicrobiota bacterium]
MLLKRLLAYRASPDPGEIESWSWSDCLTIVLGTGGAESLKYLESIPAEDLPFDPYLQGILPSLIGATAIGRSTWEPC